MAASGMGTGPLPYLTEVLRKPRSSATLIRRHIGAGDFSPTVPIPTTGACDDAQTNTQQFKNNFFVSIYKIGLDTNITLL